MATFNIALFEKLNEATVPDYKNAFQLQSVDGLYELTQLHLMNLEDLKEALKILQTVVNNIDRLESKHGHKN